MVKSGVISIDDGGHSTCVVTKTGQYKFPSVKGHYGNRTLTEPKGKYDYIVDYKGEKYVMGDLAKYDCRYPLQMHTKTKLHNFFDLSVLVAIHQFGYEVNYVVTSVPISMHNQKEKEGRLQRLKGEHILTINGVTKKFYIEDVKVAPETASAFWVNQPEGKSRFLDLGSRTIGYATTINEHDDVRFIDTESGTMDGKGIEALGKDYNPRALADLICGRLQIDWSSDDDVFLLGGGALEQNKDLVNCIREYFPKSSVIDNPQMANAKGMYTLGRMVYDLA